MRPASMPCTSCWNARPTGSPSCVSRGEEINYRRFFDINDLVGLRMENPRVFAETHKLMRRLLADDLIAGVRIDHPDGLLNPAEYFVRMQRLYAASRCLGAGPASPRAGDGVGV